jgi:hypothetical protein
MEYRQPGGYIFEYEVLPETRTGLWAADGYLKSDPNIRIRTDRFKNKDDAVKAFMEWAKRIPDRQKADAKWMSNLSIGL